MKTIAVTYEINTEASAENGDAEERGFDYRNVPSFETADEAAEWMLNEGAVEASSSSFVPDVWYTSEANMDRTDGSETRYSFHPKGFSIEEQALIYDRIQSAFLPTFKS